jgi:hypothetical protein
LEIHMRLLAAAALMAMSATITTATANPSQGLYDPLTGRYVVATPSNAGGGRAAATPIPRETVSFKSSHRPGTIIVNVAERRLYLVERGRGPSRFRMGRHQDRDPQDRVAIVDAASPDAAPPP